MLPESATALPPRAVTGGAWLCAVFFARAHASASAGRGRVAEPVGIRPWAGSQGDGFEEGSRCDPATGQVRFVAVPHAFSYHL